MACLVDTYQTFESLDKPDYSGVGMKLTQGEKNLLVNSVAPNHFAHCPPRSQLDYPDFCAR